MIQANELRIGNLINIRDESHIIYDIMPDGINTFDYGLITFDYIYPIELTEELLIKAGFKKHKESDNFYMFSIGDNPITHDFILLIKYIKDENKFFFNNGFHIIKSVHNLQNLYFALTGEELVFNL